ncbi:MAG TPA: ribosome small subunit-dependent GTPase A [Ktedonobacterales bacterium]
MIEDQDHREAPADAREDDSAVGNSAQDAASGVQEQAHSVDGKVTRLEGIVTALAPGFFEVAADNGQSYLCTLRGRLRASRPARPISFSQRSGSQRSGASRTSSRTPGRTVGGRGAATQAAAEAETAQPPTRIAAGDRVRLTPLSPVEGVIEEVLPRRTVLARARGEHATEHVMLANPDVAVLVFATQEPEPHFGLLDRYLALCERAGVQAVICLNKDDLGVPGDVGSVAEQYAALGYPILYTSAATGDGVERLRELLNGNVSLLTGESGVGKSSLTNLLAPGAAQRTGEISVATGLGRHTTTGVRLLPLPEGGWLADSAGIRELSLWNVPADELAQCFVELRPFLDQCLYEDCTHSESEDGCALRGALQSGAISPQRWASFERLLTDARAEEKPEWASRTQR